jgi:hypothetical protein
MSAVFKDVEMAWEGKTYTVKPTMLLLNQIEQRVSLAGLVRGLATEAPPLSHLAFVVGSFLRAGGARVEDEEVYRELMTGTAESFTAMQTAIFSAIFPDPKKKEVPAKTKK